MNNDIFNMPNRATFKTYSHLAEKKRVPNDYEVTSTKMLYYLDKGGFEVTTPVAAWYDRYQKNSVVNPKGLEEFSDPHHTTYSSYISRQKDKEIVLESHLKFIDESEYDKRLNKDWLSQLAMIFAPLRYPWHGFQMVSSYLGSMAPEGKIVIACSFQTMDEMRRIQWVAYRIRQLQLTHPNWGEDSLNQWQNAAHWQPLRRGIENLLTTYDWMEAFVALNLCVKPLFDQLILNNFATLATTQGDPQLELMSRAFYEESQWQQLWSHHLIPIVLNTEERHKEVISNWASYWINEMATMIKPFSMFFPRFDLVQAQLFGAVTEKLKEIGLELEVTW